MKTAPPENPRQLTPQFDYAVNFCRYGWFHSIDECGKQSRSLGPVNSLTGRMECATDPRLPLYQVHELPVLE